VRPSSPFHTTFVLLVVLDEQAGRGDVVAVDDHDRCGRC
jgi:hypothetical protein